MAPHAGPMSDAHAAEHESAAAPIAATNPSLVISFLLVARTAANDCNEEASPFRVENKGDTRI
jgi:hypothetical protein